MGLLKQMTKRLIVNKFQMNDGQMTIGYVYMRGCQLDGAGEISVNPFDVSRCQLIKGTQYRLNVIADQNGAIHDDASTNEKMESFQKDIISGMLDEKFPEGSG